MLNRAPLRAGEKLITRCEGVVLKQENAFRQGFFGQV